ncbi:MAG TPA: phospholipase A [Flavobacterium sp.]|uniref:phospholipase A n=1 Tax=Flavobacterium sp. TaxID=239 RepID=UPI002DBAA373|nr:phospholipase A [Flavobacterium sp.]HEU4792001.1 phospholipase A [Flavobacterium sp.]
MKKHTIIISLTFLLFSLNLFSQITVKDSIKNLIDNAPSFTIYQDNYFVSGSSLNDPISSNTSDAKFQISFKQRITKATLPFDTQLFLTYTQKSFWKIFNESSPFAETNYNPAFGISKFFIGKNKSLKIVAIAYEHESNGRDSIYSRSWNRISFHYMQDISKTSTIKIKAWIPLQYDENPDLIKYVGYGEISFSQKLYKGRFIFDVTSRKGASSDGNFSVSSQLSYLISKKDNQYITLQYYNGYAESLIDYNQKTNMLRVGIVIKPFKSFFY